ncbi:hypothetical protein IFM89_025510 [Coptis chinensis]|uniref:Uncharacterized protein n=1 Tax=Coptis chinensis TaxID=261450 RepID=A0A835LNJ0_9MAGN|nr:hypothetical protein IFM89_025510 [Coptis chinensis]
MLFNLRRFHSHPVGTVLTASLGDSSMRSQREDWFAGINFCRPENKCALLGDFFVSLSCTAQHGNFQRFFFDLTRAHARLDFPSGSNLVAGAARLAQDLYKSQRPDLEAVQAVCPKVTLSFQQQVILFFFVSLFHLSNIFGEFSFRVDSSLAFDLTRRDRCPQVDDTVYSLEYALKVLGSAKAVAWYSSKNREAMVELRFFET